jgi:hypothetical protein
LRLEAEADIGLDVDYASNDRTYVNDPSPDRKWTELSPRRVSLVGTSENSSKQIEENSSSSIG